MKQTIIYPFLPPTLNEIIKTARTHKQASAKEKKKWTDNIALESIELDSYESMVWVTFEWRIANWARDPDNIAGAAKFIFDGLKEAGIIKDDSLKYIGSPVVHYYTKVRREEESCIVTLDSEPYKQI